MKPQSAMKRASGVLATTLTMALACLPPRSGATDVGEIATDFTATHRATGATRTLYGNYGGEVIVLDFFAYWCGPCRTASTALKTELEQYYHDRGGNPAGIPVRVVPVNIDSTNENSTNQFITDTGMDPQAVLNDYASSAYRQFSTGYIPLLVILNGVAGSTSHDQWEVLYRASGWGSGTPAALRAAIDAVQAADTVASPAISKPPVGGNVLEGRDFQLSVRATGSAPLAYQWFKDGQTLGGATDPTLRLVGCALDASGNYTVRVSNPHGSVTGDPVCVRVLEGGLGTVFAATGLPLEIPDNNSAGVRSAIEVSGAARVLAAKLSLVIRHPYSGDLLVKLISPAGTDHTVHNLSGGSADDVVVAGLEIGAFGGENGSGAWTLSAADRYAGDVGRIESWSLELLHYDDLLEAYCQWQQGQSQLAGSRGSRHADPDGDGLDNLFEFLLEGQSPLARGTGPQLVPAGAASPTYHEFLLRRRAGVADSWCWVETSDTMAAGTWQKAQTRGNEILVDSPAPGQTRVRIHKTLPRSFVRIAAAAPPA